MKIIKVTYTTTLAFADQNQKNIREVMNDLQKANHPGINYNSCLSADGKTFIHSAFFNSEDDHKTLNELPSFKYFQEQLKANGFEAPPKQELLDLVGSSKPLFN
jgi:hypothetical protein